VYNHHFVVLLVMFAVLLVFMVVRMLGAGMHDATHRRKHRACQNNDGANTVHLDLSSLLDFAIPRFPEGCKHRATRAALNALGQREQWAEGLP